MQTETLTVKQAGLTLSHILAKHYRRVIPGACETVWEINQDLARTGPFVAVGTVLTVPVADSFAEASGREVVGLFD